MSTLQTLSSFYYGTTVTLQNRSIDFNEGGPELQATIKVGSYSLTDYAAAVQLAMREAGTQDYVVTVNRTTRQLTITAPIAFTLLANTGSRVGTGAWTMMGYAATDVTGTSLQGGSGAGSVYRPQYLLKNYTSAEDYKTKESASVVVSASGKVQTLQFGDGNRIKMNITVITDKVNLKQPVFYSNASGVSDARAFIDFLITKGTCEFMPDFATPNNYVRVLLESSKTDRNGVAIELQNMGVPDFYETGDLTFRKVLT